MTGVTTGAYVAGLAAVVFVNLAASVTTLACVARIDIDDFYTTYYGSVGNVSAETVEKYISEQKSRQVVKDATTRVAVSR